MDLEGNNEPGHKRSDLDKIAGGSGDAKSLRGGDHAIDMDDDDEEVFDIYVKNWIFMYGGWAKFDEPNGPMLPMFPEPMDTMEIFVVKVAQIAGGLEWPLQVYGDVAVRDSLDQKRNYLFRRGRDDCQALTSPQDSLLELTGPSRAVILLDNPVFEIDLKVKGEEESEDNVLCYKYFGYDNLAYRGADSYARTEMLSSKNRAIEVRFAHVTCSLEATISIQMTTGSGNFWARLTACTASIGEKVVLLDTGGREVSVAEDGKVYLQRRVVVVEEQGKLILGFEAAQLGGDSAESSITTAKEMTFPARCALRSESYFVIGPTRLHVVVAWSLLP
ncbi:hypothetical protein HU200_059594 [Digitaria exilis]|uniref:DUF6598 domain-containing protein n=1 Tax=Digitaria exilis TaxID=1010633 RepID=A0A835DYD0_9POAL|nr:hypothetical protein HU200_059594 [Digitaria exilis]